MSNAIISVWWCFDDIVDFYDDKEREKMSG